MSADSTAHLNAAFLLLGLFTLARAVPSPFWKRSMKNLSAEEGARAMELTEVTESDDGIHVALETHRPVLGEKGNAISWHHHRTVSTCGAQGLGRYHQWAPIQQRWGAQPGGTG